jgi:mannitol/fructose-specific phosphotransferase system IIA component (Ntr-type)
MSQFGIAIPVEQIVIIPPGADKEEALNLLVTAVSANPVVADRDVFRRAVFEREAIMSTGIGNGVGVPHVRIPEVGVPTLGVGVSRGGIDFSSLDGKPVRIMVLFATPLGAEKVYLSLLAKVMLVLRNRALFEALTACDTPEQVHALLCE